MKENVLERNARMDTDRKIADFRVKQQMDYAFKVKYARIRAWEFYNHPDVAGNCYVAVGGLDSITLLLFLRSIGIDVLRFLSHRWRTSPSRGCINSLACSR